MQFKYILEKAIEFNKSISISYYYLGRCIHCIVNSVLESALRVEGKRPDQTQMLGLSLRII